MSKIKKLTKWVERKENILLAFFSGALVEISFYKMLQGVLTYTLFLFLFGLLGIALALSDSEEKIDGQEKAS